MGDGIAVTGIWLIPQSGQSCRGRAPTDPSRGPQWGLAPVRSLRSTRLAGHAEDSLSVGLRLATSAAREKLASEGAVLPSAPPAPLAPVEARVALVPPGADRPRPRAAHAAFPAPHVVRAASPALGTALAASPAPGATGSARAPDRPQLPAGRPRWRRPGRRFREAPVGPGIA